jgi:hypothetical protein
VRRPVRYANWSTMRLGIALVGASAIVGCFTGCKPVKLRLNRSSVGEDVTGGTAVVERGDGRLVNDEKLRRIRSVEVSDMRRSSSAFIKPYK